MAKRSVTMAYTDDECVLIRIPCSEREIKEAPMSRGKPNRPGKNKNVATSGGFVQVDGAPDGVRISFNLIAYPEGNRGKDKD